MERENTVKMMPDREKIIEAVEEAFDIWIDEYEGTSYYNIDEVKNLKADALALLKEQEAVKPTWGRGKPFCGACGLQIRGGKFCSECGKPIAWEGR